MGSTNLIFAVCCCFWILIILLCTANVKEKHVPVHGNNSTVLKSVVVESNNFYFDIQNCRDFHSLEIPWN
jgi:hypothetical protein